MPPKILLELQRFVEAWIERSATCPLSVSLTSESTFFGNLGLERHLLVPQILAVSRRLRSLTLDAAAERLRPILELGPEDLPLLKSLRMNISDSMLVSTNLLRIPTLEAVTLSATLRADPLSLPLPWSQLKRLHFACWVEYDGKGLEIDGALELLRRCPNLEWCKVLVTESSEYSSYNSSPIILPHLHTLAFRGLVFSLQNWIPDLVAPNLRSLHIGDHSPSPMRSHHARLSVDLDLTSYFTTTGLRECLQSLPTISHLKLIGCTLYYNEPVSSEDTGFIALLVPPHSLCPMLTHLEIVGPPINRVSDTHILALIKARMAMPTPLQRFRARFDRPMDFDIMPELQSFISDGLQVDLGYLPPRWTFRARDGLDEPEAFH
ncbi:hypothetical protein C8R45DRAFT_1089718 [Mycena sanguinolenta]|nr:hypothetical protein C8R45DRAFT_1089718 [Mycena sanguinolenta]